MPGQDKKVSIPDSLVSKIQHTIGMGERIDMAFVDRRSDTGEPMMLSTEVTGVYKKSDKKTTLAVAAGVDLPEQKIPESRPTYDAFYKGLEKTVSATWYNVAEKRASAAPNAAVSGPLGTLNVSAYNLNFEVIDPRFVSAEFLKQYNTELIPLDKKITIDCGNYDDIFFINYKFNNKMNYDSPTPSQDPQGLYMDTYVFNPKRGGGQTVETHGFPHYWIGRSTDCTGAVLLGRKIEDCESIYKFAMFKVPVGYSFKAGSNAIHSDSWLHGDYSVSLNIGEVDVVSMRTADDEILRIKQVSFIMSPAHTLFAPPKFPCFLMRFGAMSTSSMDDVAACLEIIAQKFSVVYAQDEFEKYAKWYRCHKGHADVLKTLEERMNPLFKSTEKPKPHVSEI